VNLFPLYEVSPGLSCSESLACSETLACAEGADEVALTALNEDSKLVVLLPGKTETLTPLAELARSTEFLHPGMSTFPSATTWPGEYGTVFGMALGVLAPGTEVLTAIGES
jgi:hypothetical protein